MSTTSSQGMESMAPSNPQQFKLSGLQKLGLAVGAFSILLILTGVSGHILLSPNIHFWFILGSASLGVLIYAYAVYSDSDPGIKNNGVWFYQLTNRGAAAWVLGIVLTGFYVLLYWYPETLGLGTGQTGENTGLVAVFDPLSQALKGKPASQWFVYGTLYTLAILIFGGKFLYKYRHNKYQIWRTISVMFFQLAFAFLLPEFLLAMDLPYNDFKNMWPLNYYFFDGWNIKQMMSSGTLGICMLVWGVAMIFIVSPMLTYFYGKRWYCSWVCGCGGLAETAGDPFRHLSDKSIQAWKIERWLVHGVLVFVVVMTLGVLYSFFTNEATNILLSRNFLVIFVSISGTTLLMWMWLDSYRFRELDQKAKWLSTGIGVFLMVVLLVSHFSGFNTLYVADISGPLRKWYGFLIGAAFSGVVGVGFYPLLGNRVWCRFGCPMAAILGIQQKFFSRFRITTNGGQCISCGNCSTYCEMGIDVRAYAQKGQNIVRASCVGCGICAAVCPRGVLKLENGSLDISEKTDQKHIQFVREDEVRVLH
ncbi:MAG TPA: 4Fe-4S dicluster domain-containing protein [Saprospiraceae bacterium]|nr:4Fe-4S dicluster domain-containing protein [Saprospiraceae bacterium]